MSMPKRVRARTWRPPLPPPAEAQTPQNQHAESLEPDAQASAASIRPPCERGAEGLCLMWRAHIPDTDAASGPNQQPGRILIPGDGAAGIRTLRIGMPARRWRYATPAACPVSTTSWRYGLRRTCRLVTGRSHRPQSTWPDQARLAFLAVTHRYRRVHCLWLEQFQIADYVRLPQVGYSTGPARRRSSSVRPSGRMARSHREYDRA
jgi:hypothetical protein